ncbi:MAG: hypothetical protein AAF614_11745 [Chloroflexota bacterium]
MKLSILGTIVGGFFLFVQWGAAVASTVPAQASFVWQNTSTGTCADLQPIPLPSGNQWYVSTNFHPDNDGSINSPWDLESVFWHRDEIQPGDTVWVRGGVYQDDFRSVLTGTTEAPILVRAYPGERVIIDNNSAEDDVTLDIDGAWTIYWGLEVMNSHTARYSDESGSFPNLKRGGVTAEGLHTKLINLNVHDLGTAVGFWKEVEEGEIHGSIIYNTGWQAPDRGHGHAIYTQNQLGTKCISDNIMFNQFGYGLHAYGSSSAHLKGFHVEGNVSFNNGSISTAGWAPDYLIGGANPAERINFVNNFSHRSQADDGSVQLGWPTQASQDLVVDGNYFGGGGVVLSVQNWAQATVTNNTFFVMDGLLDTVGVNVVASTWDNNQYFDAGVNTTPIYLPSGATDYAGWQQTYGYDQNSSYTIGALTGLDVFVLPNRYEPGRGHLVIYNWDDLATVAADISDIVPIGASYEIRNAQDYYAAPVLSGTYAGGTVTLPMAGITPVAPVGGGQQLAPVTGPTFQVFVVQVVDELTAVSPTLTPTPDGNDLTLNWPANTPNNCRYEIYQGDSPYFAPEESGTLLGATNGATFDLTGVFGDPATANYYLVRAINCLATDGADSTVLGAFEFAITSGG